MKLVIHPEVLVRQRYTCRCCGAGCRSFLVPVTEAERRSIESLEAWREKFGAESLFVKTKEAGEGGYGLAKRADGRCVFLDERNLCAIHALHGIRAKPLACQLFPFVFTPVGGTLRVGLRFDCPAVCESVGKSLGEYLKECQSLAGKMVPAGAEGIGAPEIRRGQKVSVEQFDAVNEILIGMVQSDAMPLIRRLHWMRLFAEHVQKIRWKNVGEEDFGELVKMLRGGLLAESQKMELKREAIAPRARKLLGQIFFLLCHPTEYIHAKKPPWMERIRQRLKEHAMLGELGRASGPLPRLRGDWPECDLSRLEESFGAWPADVEEFLARYLTCRLGGLNYCGPNFYNYSLAEGVQSLLLGCITAGWAMRIAAVRAGRDKLAIADAYEAVMAMDGNLGYARALGSGPARLRLEYLSGHLGAMLNGYCQ